MPCKLRPIHPGAILREDFLRPLGLSSARLARALHVSEGRIRSIVRERRGITADTALRLARYFGTDVRSWLNLQTHYELQCAEDLAGTSLKAIRPLDHSSPR